ncbi:MAG: hypothetical protein ACP5NK_07880 [Thermoplasmata archaeon]
MESRKSLSILIALILTLFVGLLFYYIVTRSSEEFSGLAIIGLLSLLFAFIGYLLYAFIGISIALRGFVWAYYIFGFGALFYSVLVLKFSIVYLLLLLLMLVVSLVLIRWRVGAVHSIPVKGGTS